MAEYLPERTAMDICPIGRHISQAEVAKAIEARFNDLGLSTPVILKGGRVQLELRCTCNATPATTCDADGQQAISAVKFVTRQSRKVRS
jgi:hypothetical protein